MDQELLTFLEHSSLPVVFSVICLVHFVQWYVFTFLDLCCDVLRDFCIKTTNM